MPMLMWETLTSGSITNNMKPTNQQPTGTNQKPRRKRVRLYDRILNDPTILVA